MYLECFASVRGLRNHVFEIDLSGARPTTMGRSIGGRIGCSKPIRGRRRMRRFAFCASEVVLDVAVNMGWPKQASSSTS